MDLIVGGSIIVALFILIAGVLWLKEVSVTRKLVSFTALFPNVGTLQVGDPVMANGVPTGSVTSIRLRGNSVAVEISVDRSLHLTDSCRIIVQNIGLMGERGIGIQMSPGGKIWKPSSKSDTTFIPGYFDTGIAEAMGMLGDVLTEVKTLVKNVNAVVTSTVGDSSFNVVFQKLVIRLDSISEVAENLLQKNEPLINSSVRDIAAVSADLKSLLSRNGPYIDTIVQNGASLTGYGINIVNRIDTLALTVQHVIDKVDSGKGSIGLLMNDEQFYYDLKSTIGNLDTLINEVKYDALKLRVKLGFGKKK
jgi:phospholipid/cholesterol/gamma-HCH transport system substrate-binding protein